MADSTKRSITKDSLRNALLAKKRGEKREEMSPASSAVGAAKTTRESRNDEHLQESNAGDGERGLREKAKERLLRETKQSAMRARDVGPQGW